MYLRFEAFLYRHVVRSRSLRVLLGLAILIAIPTLFAGFFLDDYIHLLTLRGEETIASPYDLFQFATGDPNTIQHYITTGPYPWYTLPELKLHFFRPLSSATMVLDRLCFGENAFAYHVHNVFWYLALVSAVFLLFRKSMTVGLASLCCLIYLLDDGHIIPVLWWSNRNAVVAAAPAVFGLVAHLRWRESQWRPGLPLSLAGYGLGLLGGETALGIFGYLIAYECVQRRDAWQTRFRALVPAGLLAVGYLAVYKAANYGVYGSGVYLDPISEWRAYLQNAPLRFADLVGTQFFSLPLELPIVHVAFQTPLLIASLLATAMMLFGLRVVWHRCSSDEQRLLCWMGLGATIATLPVLATFPSGRLLLLPSIGASVWIGLFIQKGLAMGGERPPRILRYFGRCFLLLHLVAMPVYWVVASTVLPAGIRLADDAFHEMEIDHTNVSEQQVFCLFAPDAYTGFYPFVMRHFFGYPRAKGWQTLSLAPVDHELTRTGTHSFEVRPIDGELFSTFFERLLRSETFAYHPGDTVALAGYEVEILETGVWGPTRFALRFDYPLEDERYQFLAWQDGRLSPIQWAPVGEPQVYRKSDGYFGWAHFKKRLPLL